MPSGQGEVQWLRLEKELFLPVLAGAVVGIFAILLMVLAGTLIPGFSMVPAYPSIVFLTAFESVYVTRVAKRKNWGFGQRMREVLALALVARLAVAMSAGGVSSLPEIVSISGWFSDRAFIIHALGLIGAWSWGNGLSDDLDRLTYLPLEGGGPKGSSAYDRWHEGARHWLQAGRTRLVWLKYLTFALVSIIGVGMYQQLGARALDRGRSLPALIWLSAGFYALGLFLLSYVHQLRLRIGWLERGHTSVLNVSRAWVKAAVGVVTMVLVLSFLLPANYSPVYGKSTWLTKLLDELLPHSDVAEDAGKVGESFSSIAEGLGRLVRAQGSNAPVQRTFLTGIFEYIMRNIDTIKKAGLAGVLVILAFYLIWPFLRGRGWPRLSRQTATSWLQAAAGILAQVVRAAAGFLAELSGWLLSVFSPRRWFGSSRREAELADALGLSPLERLRRAGLSKQALHLVELYRRMINLAAQRGLPYRKHQTASEYSDYLGCNVPGMGAPIDGLTSRMLLVRYGRMELGKDDVRVAEEFWQEIRARLTEPGKPTTPRS